MAVVTLTFIASVEEITSGIPQTVTIESNVLATVYYTIDGSQPTINSSVYIDHDPIEFPTDVDSVMLQAFGIGSDGYAGLVLAQTFAANTTRISVARNVGMEGFVLDREWIGPNIPDRYGADGYAAAFLDVNPDFLHMTATEKGYDGIEPGTIVEIGTPPLGTEGADMDETFVPFSTTQYAKYFNPYARVILIDNRKDNEVKIILRPWGSFEDIYKEFGGIRVRSSADEACYVSGGYVSRFYSAATKTMVSYYFDHNEARWIKNIQQLPSNIQMPRNIGVQASAGQPLVFPWIPRGRQSGLV